MLGLGGNIFNLGVCVAAGCGAVLFFVFVSFVGRCYIFFCFVLSGHFFLRFGVWKSFFSIWMDVGRWIL